MKNLTILITLFLASCKVQTIQITSSHAPKQILSAKEFYRERGYKWVSTRPFNDTIVILSFKKRF